MNKKAIIIDMDNTIYPVHSISAQVFKVLYDLIAQGGHSKKIEEITSALKRRPFQIVAEQYLFSDQLKKDCTALLREITIDEVLHPFEDYSEIRKISLPKYLVTTGFEKLQRSKIRQLGIEDDFAGIHIVDLDVAGSSKKAVFRQIMSAGGFAAADLIVVGDDLNSEIKAGQELGIDAILYAPAPAENSPAGIPVITHFRELLQFL